MPPQPPPVTIPDNNLTVVPGSRNLIASELLDEFILALATARGAQAQTNLAQLAASPQFALTAAKILKALQPVSGTSGNVLTSNGLLVPPSFQPPGGGPTPSARGRVQFIGEYGNANSELCVSEQMYTLRKVYKTFGKNTWTVRTDWIPNTTPNECEVRVDGGMDGETRGEHPAAGLWDVIAGKDPLGNANPFCFELLLSVYKPNCVFTKGHMYVPGTQFDGAGPVNALAEEISDSSNPLGPGTWYWPPGCIWAQSATMRLPWCMNIIGHGGYNTTLVLADSSLQPPEIPHVSHKFHTVLACGAGDSGLYANVTQVRYQGFRVLGNRARQRFGIGGALVALGGEADTGEPDIPPYSEENVNAVSVWMDDFGGSGAAGYWMTLGGHNAKQQLLIGRLEISWSDSDLIDCKNRQSLNEIIWIQMFIGKWWAMGDQGTNLRPDIPLGLNGITTTAGESTITVPLSLMGTFTTPGDIGTIRAGATSGNGIDPVGSWPIIETANSLVKLDVSPQVASGTGGIGGAAPEIFAPQISVGDVTVDTRGIGWVVDILWAYTMAYARNGPRQRGGAGDGNSAGLGGLNAIFGKIFFTDVSPAFVIGTTGVCRGIVTAIGDGLSVGQLRATSTGGAIGIHCGATASNARFIDVQLNNMSIACKFEGDRCVVFIGRFIDTIDKNTEVFGDVLNDLIDLNPDPASGTTGSPIVTITTPNPHNHLTGDKAGFIGLVNSNGSTLRPSNDPPPYLITVTSPTTFTVVGSGNVTNGAIAWGGPNASVRFVGADHIAIKNEFHHLSFQYTAPDGHGGDGVVGLSIGAQTQSDGGVSFGQADGTIVHFVRDEGSEFPCQDFGTNTEYVVGNSGGIPNRPIIDVLDVPPLTSSSITNNLIFEVTVDPANPVTAINVTSLIPYDELLVEIEDITHNSLTNQNWGIELSIDNGDTWLDQAADYMRFGTTNAGKLVFSNSVAAGTKVSGLVQFTNFNLSGERTEAWINAGTNSDGANLQNASGCAVTHQTHTALRIIPSLNSINGGTVRVYGKQGGDIGS